MGPGWRLFCREGVCGRTSETQLAESWPASGYCWEEDPKVKPASGLELERVEEPGYFCVGIHGERKDPPVISVSPGGTYPDLYFGGGVTGVQGVVVRSVGVGTEGSWKGAGGGRCWGAEVVGAGDTGDLW